ncbi:hypothetical protein BDW22DRAFT_842253 [Trametopsis cervina]|nr:hypothetical protein BDW22DRAFT_842253 [Trametopsis cervina]
MQIFRFRCKYKCAQGTTTTTGHAETTPHHHSQHGGDVAFPAFPTSPRQQQYLPLTSHARSVLSTTMTAPRTTRRLSRRASTIRDGAPATRTNDTTRRAQHMRLRQRRRPENAGSGQQTRRAATDEMTHAGSAVSDRRVP